MYKKRKTKKAKPDRVSPVPTRFQPYRNCANRPVRFSFFLDLPAELRNLVYSNILRLPGAIDADYFWNKPSIDLSLLRVSKQVGREAAHYFYSTNTFCFLEACDDHQEDHDAVFEHRAHYWLKNVSKTNRLSIQRLQLRMREERDIEYYERLLGYICSQTPNVKRLALVMERHHIVHLHTATNAHIADWQPNYVIPIKEDQMPRVANGIKSLNLRLLVLAETRDHIEVLKKLSALFQCQIRAIDPKDARRQDNHCLNFLEQKVWYESPGDAYNRQIRQDISLSGLDEYFEDDKSDEDDGEEGGAGSVTHSEIDIVSDDD